MRPSPIRTALLALALLPVLAGAAAGQAEKLLPIDAVEFAIGSADGVFVGATTSNPAREQAVLPVSFKVYGPDAPPSVRLVQVKVAYDAAELAFVAGDAGAWPGDSQITDAGGVVTVILDAATIAAPTTFLDVCTLTFTPLCQPELSASTVTLLTGPGESFVSYDDVQYTDPGARTGTVTTADYEAYVSVLDPDPFDAEPVSLALDGVVGAGAVVDVPIYIASNANVSQFWGMVTFDPTKLAPATPVPGNDCNPWVWSFGPPSIDDGFFYVVLSNYPFADNDSGEPCLLMTVPFTVVGDWRGEQATVGFQPIAQGPQVGNGPGDTCHELSTVFTYHDGTLVMNPYKATVTTDVDLIYADDVGTDKRFTATVFAAHNFTIGGDDAFNDEYASALRVDLDLGPDLSILSLYQPTAADPDRPLDDFYFSYNIESTKSPNQKIEFYSRDAGGVIGTRAPTAEPESLFTFDFNVPQVSAPTAFDPDGIPLTYQCTFEDRAARVRDAVTGTLEVACGAGLVFGDAPELDHASGELSCDQSTSTRPASVVQHYWVRSLFPLTQFRVTVQKSGPHGIVGVDPAPGVIVLAQTSTSVTFGHGPDWEPAVHETRLRLGSITYNTYVVPDDPVFDKGGEPADKDIQPGPTWCWQWTDIAFGADSFLRDGTGRETFLFTAANRVGTRYDCSFTDRRDTADPSTKAGAPKAFVLAGNHPNPFNPETTIAFGVPRAAPVTLEIHDLQGRLVATLVDGVLPAGFHEAVWRGRDDAGRAVASGTYFAVLRSPGQHALHKLTLLK